MALFFFLSRDVNTATGFELHVFRRVKGRVSKRSLGSVKGALEVT